MTKKVIRFITEDGRTFEIDRDPVEQRLLEMVVSKTDEINAHAGAMLSMVKPLIGTLLGDFVKDKPKDVDVIEWAGYYAVTEGLNNFPEEGLLIPELREVTADGE